MAAIQPGQRGRVSGLLIWSAGFLLSGVVLGAWLRDGFGAVLQGLLLGLALLYAVAAVVLWRRRQSDAAPRGAPRRWLRRWQWLLVGTIVAFPVAVVLHNVVAGLTGVEEPVFFLIAVIVAPLAFVAGAIGMLVTVLRAEIGHGPRQSDPP